MDLSTASLRVLRAVTEHGSFTAAATALGYTQSAVSRQIAALEGAAGARLFDRSRTGVRLTAAGRVLLAHASIALDELDAAARELSHRDRPARAVRLGAFASAGAVLVPRAVERLRRTHPDIRVTTREASTPGLVRALRARTIDLAVIAVVPPFRPPDTEAPPLVRETIREADLMVAVPANHPLAGQDSVHVDELRGQSWIASPSGAAETALGVWPGLAGPARVAHVSRDWLTKLQLVAAGCGITTVSGVLVPALPPDVAVLHVLGGAHERRRLELARLPRHRPAGLSEVADAVRAVAREF